MILLLSACLIIDHPSSLCLSGRHSTETTFCTRSIRAEGRTGPGRQALLTKNDELPYMPMPYMALNGPSMVDFLLSNMTVNHFKEYGMLLILFYWWDQLKVDGFCIRRRMAKQRVLSPMPRGLFFIFISCCLGIFCAMRAKSKRKDES